MQRVRTESSSSNIRAFEYDPAASKLTIEFRNGGRYEYAGVTGEHHEALQRATSHGKHFHAHIKGSHAATKLN